MINPDNQPYYKFTGPQRLDRAIHTLEGILAGIAADRKATASEIAMLSEWVTEHDEFKHRHPFNEIIPTLRDALADGVVSDEELADVVWLCSRIKSDNAYFCAVSSDMQRLHGIMSGIVADGEVNMAELDALTEWMADHEHLRRCWPFDEVESLLLAVRADKVIDEREQRLLLSFLSEFSNRPGHRALGLPLNEVNVPITGLCAVCPEVEFDGRRFCFTGASTRLTRKKLAELVSRLGGTFWPRLRKDVDYLVIGADGNPCWAFSCYGRKVEEAVNMRKSGSKILLVHEHDFWDAVQDSNVGPL